MTDEANGSVILAELYVAFFRESNNQRLSPWGWPLSCFPDLITDLCQNINHGLTPRLLEQVLLVYYQLLQTFPFSVQLFAISTSS